MSEWLVIPEPKPQASRVLVVFHHAGGSAQGYASLVSRIPSSMEVQLVELPGRGFHRAASCGLSFSDVCSRLEIEISDACAGRELYFFGHSMGGLLAFEVACRLAGRVAIRRVGVSATAPKPLPVPTERELEMYVSEPAALPESVRKNPSSMNIFVKRLLSDLQMLQGACSRPLLGSDVGLVVVGGDADAFIPAENLREWESFCDSVSIKIVPGGHFYFDGVPDVTAILDLKESA
jgi:medium-chain acyl-[acyl-carrier-protein] hydrolase